MRQSHVSVVLLAACALAQSGCWKRVKAPELKSPYQLALEAYYQAIDKRPPDFSKALAAANDLLTKTPADLEARSLRSQIYLRTVKPLDPQSREPLLNDLSEIVQNVGAPPAAAWVQPRALVTAGDLLVLVGNELNKQANSAGANFDRLDAFRAYQLFDAARSFYGRAGAYVEAVKTNVPTGLLREGENTRDGYTRAIEGALNALRFVDPQTQSPLTAARRRDLLADMRQIFDKTSIPPARPGIATLDPRDHEAQRSLYTRQAVAARTDLIQWCKTFAADASKVKDGEALLAAWRDGRERALLHAQLQRLLNPRATDDTAEAQALELAYDRSRLSEACKAP